MPTVGAHAGAHIFRRFRLTWIRKQAAPKDLERFWMGHAIEEVGDLYSKLKEDVEFRKEVTERIGLGFSCTECTEIPTTERWLVSPENLQ